MQNMSREKAGDSLTSLKPCLRLLVRASAAKDADICAGEFGFKWQCAADWDNRECVQISWKLACASVKICGRWL